jgi:formiminotetrahydrofolate cyclodeaminase
LIEAGADVNEFGIDTYEVGDESTVEEKKTKETVLQAAVRHAKDSDPESAHELVDLLLKTVRSIDDLNENGQTAQ